MEYNSDYDIRLATLGAMGGETGKTYNSVYDIDLDILHLIEEGGGGGGGGEGRTYTGIAPISVNNTTNKISVNLSAYSTTEEATLLYNPINTTTANSSQSATSAKLPTWNANGQINGSAQVYGQAISINGAEVKSLNDSETSSVAIYAPVSAGTNGYILVSQGSGAPVWQINGIAKETVANSVSTKALDANKYYVFESRTANLTITLNTPASSDIVNEYHFMIAVPSGSTVPTITLPQGLTWKDNDTPSTLEAGATYEFSILDNIAIYAAI